MRCPSCNHDNRAERRFCGECGTAITILCPSCGSSNEPGEKFCGGCGTPLSGSKSAPPHRIRRPTSHEASAADERRQLTVLFCDLVGSTELSGRLDAEEWQDVIRRYQRSAADVLEPFGGHIAQFLGDGLLVYFGYPQAHDDDAERAMRAGLALVDALRALTDLPVTLAVRIGIHTGPVVVGELGGGAHRETLALGETTNLAARLQGVADPNTVVVSEATLRLVAGIFVTEALAPQTLKGVAAPVAAHRVVRPSGMRSRLDVDPARLTRFIGRDMELGTLVDRWERARDGYGQNVLVVGDAGVGKSRLVYQLRERLAALPHTWLECGATPYTAGTPFHPLIALVSQGLGFMPEDTAPRSSGSSNAVSAPWRPRRGSPCSPIFSVSHRRRRCR